MFSNSMLLLSLARHRLAGFSHPVHRRLNMINASCVAFEPVSESSIPSSDCCVFNKSFNYSVSTLSPDYFSEVRSDIIDRSALNTLQDPLTRLTERTLATLRCSCRR